MKYSTILLTLFDKLGINAIFRFFYKNKAMILWYHGICDDDFTLLKGYDERHIPKSMFKKHIIFLKSDILSILSHINSELSLFVSVLLNKL